MKNIDLIVADNIRARRINLGLTQKALAEKANVDHIALNKIEKKSRPAGKATVEALARALGCSAEDLYKDEASAPTPTAAALLEVVNQQAKELEALKAQLGQPLTEQELTLLSAYRLTDEMGRAAALAVMTGTVEDRKRLIDEMMASARRVAERQAAHQNRAQAQESGPPKTVKRK